MIVLNICASVASLPTTHKSRTLKLSCKELTQLLPGRVAKLVGIADGAAPGFDPCNTFLCSAAFHLEELNRFASDFIASLFRGENRPFAKQEHMDLLLEGLRQAGMPE